MITLTQTGGDNYEVQNCEVSENEDESKCKYICKKEVEETVNDDGYFFGQGDSGKNFGIVGIVIVFALTLLIFFINLFASGKDGDKLSDIIHVFGFSFWNLCFLLLIFGIAPFGYQFWVGKCKGKHPGTISPKIDKFLAAIPFIASIVLVFYPASLLLSGGITNWEDKAVLIGIFAVFTIYSLTEYWPAYIASVTSKDCTAIGQQFTHSVIKTGSIWLGYAFIAALVIAIFCQWVYMVFNGKIDFYHDINLLTMVNNIIITCGLFLTNIFGGNKFYEVREMMKMR